MTTKKRRPTGYRWLTIPGHPNANKAGRVPTHVAVVVAARGGRPLPPGAKWTMGLTPSEARAVKWYAKRTGERGLAVLRSVALSVVVYMWANRNVRAPK